MNEEIEELKRRILSHEAAAMKEWGNGAVSWGVLASAGEESLQAWYLEIGGEQFGWRNQTVRLRIWASAEDPTEPILRAVAAARRHDVTLQLLCVHEPIDQTAETRDLGSGASVTVRQCGETYPVIHLGTHGLQWPPPSI